MVDKYFSSRSFDVVSINDRFDDDTIFSIIDKVNSIKDSIVINCIGKVKQKTSMASDLLWSNTILPLELNRSLKAGHFLIHPSTDCVFAGKSSGSYLVTDKGDAMDVYGWSKLLGEVALADRKNTIVIRVSIIGPDNKTDKGLLSWFLNLPDAAVINGYINHIWNGITTLQWCECLENLMLSPDFENKKYQSNLLQLGTSNHYSKHDMLLLFKEVFDRKITINSFSGGDEVVVSKCLVPMIECKDLKSQLIELKSFLSSNQF
jgi:dTDP-4-dehydrorhamnose reductase